MFWSLWRLIKKWVATLRGRPHLEVYMKEHAGGGIILVIDYNDLFVKQLRKTGYRGVDEPDERLVDMYVNDVFRASMEDFDED